MLLPYKVVFLYQKFFSPNYKITFYNCDEIYQLCKKFFDELIVDNLIDCHEVIVKSGVSSNEFLIIYNQKKYENQHPVIFIYKLLTKNVTCNPDILLLHGAAVERNGKVTLLLASTHSGKSTLTYYLSLNNFSVISDDRIIINKETVLVQQQNMPILLREGGLHILNTYYTSTDGVYFANDSISPRYICLPKNKYIMELPISSVYFISLEKTNTIKDISSTECFSGLMMSLMSSADLTGSNLQLLKKISKNKAKKIGYKDFSFIINRIIDN